MSDERTLPALLHRQHGIISRDQALAAGMTEEALRWRIQRGGRWQQVLPRVYAMFTGPLAEVHQCQAAALWAGDGALLTGVTALRGLALTSRSMPTQMPVLIPHERRLAPTPGVRLMRTRRPPASRTVTGIAVAEPVRALADACRSSRQPTEVAGLVHEVLQSAAVSADQLRAELDCGQRRGSRLLRSVLEEYGDGVRSVVEGEAHRRILASPLPRPLLNAGLYLPDGTFLARPDAYWEEAALAFEVDSWSYHGDRSGWERTQRRHALMSAHGITVIHASPYRIRTDWPGLESELLGAYRNGRAKPTPIVRVVAV